MSSDATTLSNYNDAVSEVTGGGSEINDFVFQYWYKSNWGDLLQPAPIAVASLANLSIVAAAADFKLVPPREGFKLVQYPDSFRATINQLVDTGAIALQKSYSNFDQMQKRCAGVKPGVNNIVSLLSGERAATEAEMNSDLKRYLPSQISQLQAAVRNCLSMAQETDTMFEQLLNLTMEIHESCTATQGSNEAKLADAEMRKSILAEQKKAAEENKARAITDADDAKKSFADAQKQFNKAADDMPKAWDLVGMEFVQGLSQAVLGGVNAGINKYVAQSQQSSATTNAAVNTAGGVQTQQGPPLTAPNVTDPAYTKAQTLRTNGLALDALATGGPNKTVDWNNINSTGQSGAAWVKNSLQLGLQGTWSTDPASQQAQQLFNRGVQLAQSLQDAGASPNRQPDVVEKLVSDIARFAIDTMSFATTAMNKTGTSPLQNPGFAQPAQAPNASGSAAQMAVKNAQFKLEATQQQLDAARKTSETASNKLRDVTKELGEVLGQIAQLDFQKVDWEKIRGVLLRAIGFLCQLKGCLVDLVHFFDAVNNLVGVTMKVACDQFITLITDATKQDKSIAGITLSSWTRQAIYDQAIGAAKVAKLVEKISMIYITMYDQHVQKGVKMLLLMGQYMAGNDQGKLVTAGKEIQTWAGTASDGIRDLIADEQAKMQNDIEERMTELQNSIKKILPAPPAAMKAAITAATDAHVAEATDAINTSIENKPVYKKSLASMKI